MTEQPSSDTPHTEGHTGHEAVAGTDLVVRYATRGATGEVEIDGTGPVDLAPAVSRAIHAVRAAEPGVELHLAADHPADELDPLPEAVADHAGLPHRRDLLQLRRPLPVPADHPARATSPTVTTRPFRPGDDDAAWIRANNRSFAGHPDQGQETEQTLDARLGEGWFDAAGFLVADDPTRPGELSGFCWTKVHRATATEPALGEIYVIGVDPAHQGEGLGPAFVLAGLDHLAGIDLTTANLYVDADNAPARRLYDRLGFTTHQRRRVYKA